MSHDQWSDRNESLNALCSAIQQGTHGLILNLSLDMIDDDCVVVRGDSRSYYGVQLAILTTKLFVARHCLGGETRLSLTVSGISVELVVSGPVNDDARHAVSTHDVHCRPQLTLPVSANPKI